MPRVAALDATTATLLLPFVSHRSTSAATVVMSPRCVAATTILTISHHDAAACRVSKHVGLPLAVSCRRLAINGAVAAYATLPHRLHAHVLALAPVHVSPW